MAEKVTVGGRSVGLATGLTLIFAAAKVFGFISWSWWWVFSPIWISLLAGFAIICVVLIVIGIIAAIANWN